MLTIVLIKEVSAYHCPKMLPPAAIYTGGHGEAIENGHELVAVALTGGKFAKGQSFEIGKEYSFSGKTEHGHAIAENCLRCVAIRKVLPEVYEFRMVR